MNFWIQREQELAEGRRRANFIVTSGAFTLILLAAFLGFTLGQCMKYIGLINIIYEIMSFLKFIKLNYFSPLKNILWNLKLAQGYTCAHCVNIINFSIFGSSILAGSISPFTCHSCRDLYISCLYPL